LGGTEVLTDSFVQMLFTEPGGPWENGYNESVNGD
jgi:hypothetical protein